MMDGAFDRYPGELGTILARGLDNDPTRRPTAAELVELLRGLQ
jgi:hypothetical protein